MDFTQEIKDLREKGVSFRGIAERLNISLGKVQRCLNAVSIQSDKKIGQDPDSAPQGDNITRRELTIILEEFKQLVQTAIEERIARAVKYAVDNAISPLISRVEKIENKLNSDDKTPKEVI